MKHYLVFQRSAQDRKYVRDSGYPWDALLFAPLWAFSKGLTLQAVALTVLYGACALLMGFAHNGIVVGTSTVLCLGVFTAYNSTNWLTSLYERRGYKMSGRVKAGSCSGAMYTHRHVKRHGSLREFV